MEAVATKTVLNLGCGKENKVDVDRAFEGDSWTEVLVDADAGTKPDIVASAQDLTVFMNGSIHGVFSSHLLEHIPRKDLEKTLTEVLRVLVPGSWFYAVVPDLAIAAQEVLADRHEDLLYDAPAGPVTPLDLIYGMGKYAEGDLPLYMHRNGFTAKSLAKHLSKAGFEPVFTRRAAGQIFSKARKPEEEPTE
jgi:ubiquinone/menaquinone biosynthesis C-methylase UbiE